MKNASGNFVSCHVNEGVIGSMATRIKEEIHLDDEILPLPETGEESAVKVEYNEEFDKFEEKFNISPSFEHVDDQACAVADAQDNDDVGKKEGETSGSSKCQVSNALKRKISSCSYIRKNTFPCSKCKYIGSQKPLLLAHKARMHGETKNLLRCHTCGYSTVYKSHMKIHVESHFPPGERSYKCNYPSCIYRASCGQQLNIHLAKIHMEPKKHFRPKSSQPKKYFPCLKCSFFATQETHLLAHRAKKHGRTKNKTKCDTCGYSTVYKHHMRTHVESHFPRGEKSFKCSYPSCNFSTTYQKPLSNHLWKIHGQPQKHLPLPKKYFTCLNCSYFTTEKLDLRAHGAKIHGETENLMKCAKCGYSTVYKGSMRIHIESHFPPAERSFKCSYPNCIYSVSNRHQLNNHLSRKHGETHSSATRPALKKQLSHKKYFPCSECSYIGAQKQQLLAHMVKFHGETEGLLKCYTCAYSTTRKREMRHHVENHFPLCERTFKCSYPSCLYSAPRKCQLNRHLGKKHGETQYLKKCTKCDFACAGTTGLKYHMAIHLPNESKPLKCSYPDCTFRSIRKTQLIAHLAKSHKETQHLKKCSQCDYVCAVSSYLKTHIKTHLSNKPKPFTCSYSGCTYSASLKNQLNAHLSKYHGETQFLKKCTQCDFASTLNSVLKSHTATHLPSESKPFQCSYPNCTYSATIKQLFYAHLATKHDEKQHLKKCPKCDFVSAWSCHLKKHMATHSSIEPVKPFKCGYSGCTYSAIRIRHFNAHLANKHNETQHKTKCKQCDFVSARIDTLNIHMATHLSGESKPFQCSYSGCTYSAIQKGQFNGHLGAKHGETKYLKKCTQCDYVTAWSSNLKKHMASHTT